MSSSKVTGTLQHGAWPRGRTGRSHAPRYYLAGRSDAGGPWGLDLQPTDWKPDSRPRAPDADLRPSEASGQRAAPVPALPVLTLAMN